MQQVLASSMHPALTAFTHIQPAINPASETERPALGRRLPRSDRPMRLHPAQAAAPGPTFLDHLRRLT